MRFGAGEHGDDSGERHGGGRVDARECGRVACGERTMTA